MAWSMVTVLGPDQVAEGLAVNEFHHDVGHPDLVLGIAGNRMVAGVVDGDDGRVVQRRDGLRFTFEPGLELRVPGKVGTQQFDGNGPSQPGIDATVDVGHASAAYELPELIAPVEDTLVVTGMLSSRCDGVLGGVVTAYLWVGTVLGVVPGGETRGAVARW